MNSQESTSQLNSSRTERSGKRPFSVKANLRPELHQHLLLRLQAFNEGFRQNIAIIGPPGSGKTFQLRQLFANAPANLLLFYCPLYHESCRSLLQRLLCTFLHSSTPDFQSEPQSVRGSFDQASGDDMSGVQSLETLIQHSRQTLPKTAAAASAVESLLARRLYTEAFNRTLDIIPIIVEERGLSCVLMLDEFLYLEESGLVHAFHELGKRVMTCPRTLFILTSSSPYRARSILRERLHLLFGQFELLSLDSLQTAPTAAWIAKELKGLRAVKSISPFLIHWLGASPWYLTVFLKRLHELSVLRGNPVISEELFLQTAWDLLGSHEGMLHQWCASQVQNLTHNKDGSRALEALIQVATGARTASEIGKRIGRAGVSAALQKLVENNLAKRNGMCWMITDPVLRCWLSTVLSAQMAGSHMGLSDIRQRFDRYLQSMWLQWTQACQLTFPEQVVKLFSKFGDDTVSLDSKTGRLPKFLTMSRIHNDAAIAGEYVVADGDGRRWCAVVQEGPVSENAIASFDVFCKSQQPKPSRKIVITNTGIEQNAKLLAKTANMWIWGPEDLGMLMDLYWQL